jgi:hypothetical protein
MKYFTLNTELKEEQVPKLSTVTEKLKNLYMGRYEGEFEKGTIKCLISYKYLTGIDTFRAEMYLSDSKKHYQIVLIGGNPHTYQYVQFQLLIDLIEDITLAEVTSMEDESILERLNMWLEVLSNKDNVLFKADKECPNWVMAKKLDKMPKSVISHIAIPTKVIRKPR